MFLWGFGSHSRTFHSYGDVTIIGEERPILTYLQHSLPFGSKVSLTRHTYFNTRHLFISSSRKTRDNHTYCRAFGSGLVTTCFNDLSLSRSGIESRPPACEANALTLIRQLYNIILMIWLRKYLQKL